MLTQTWAINNSLFVSPKSCWFICRRPESVAEIEAVAECESHGAVLEVGDILYCGSQSESIAYISEYSDFAFVACTEYEGEIHWFLATVVNGKIAVLFQCNAQLRASLQIETGAWKEFHHNRNLQIMLMHLQSLFHYVAGVVCKVKLVPIVASRSVKQFAL